MAATTTTCTGAFCIRLVEPSEPPVAADPAASPFAKLSCSAQEVLHFNLAYLNGIFGPTLAMAVIIFVGALLLYSCCSQTRSVLRWLFADMLTQTPRKQQQQHKKRHTSHDD